MNDIIINSHEHLSISREINKDPNLTVDKIDNNTKKIQNEMKNAEKRYLSDLDDLQYQKSLIELKAKTGNSDFYISVFESLNEEIKIMNLQYNQQIDKLKSLLLSNLKIRKVFVDIHPLSPRLKESTEEFILSPKLVKSSSFKKFINNWNN